MTYEMVHFLLLFNIISFKVRRKRLTFLQECCWYWGDRWFHLIYLKNCKILQVIEEQSLWLPIKHLFPGYLKNILFSFLFTAKYNGQYYYLMEKGGQTFADSIHCYIKYVPTLNSIQFQLIVTTKICIKSRIRQLHLLLNESSIIHVLLLKTLIEYKMKKKMKEKLLILLVIMKLNMAILREQVCISDLHILLS